MSTSTRSAIRVSTASAVWTLSASIASVALGLRDGSAALVSFGAVQLFDFAADVVLVVHFRVGPGADHLERVVLRIVSGGLIATGVVAGSVSTVRLIEHQHADESTSSIVLAAASLVVLALLALRKHQLARALPSAALRADGNLSAVGAGLGGVTLAGVTLTRAFGWTWSDPMAALVIAVGAIGLGVLTHRAGSWESPSR